MPNIKNLHSFLMRCFYQYLIGHSKSSNNNEAAVVKVWKNAHIRFLNTILANKINYLYYQTFVIVVSKKLWEQCFSKSAFMKMQALCALFLIDA